MLSKLARGDLVEYQSLGNWFGKINDPILNEFLKVWGQVAVEKQNPGDVEKKTIKDYQKIKRRFNEYKGYLGEIYMIQVLWNSQNRTLPGSFFHSEEDIKMPIRFIYVDQRHRERAGKKMEVDVYASAGDEVWLAESKWWAKKQVGPDAVKNLLKQREIVKKREEEGGYSIKVYMWIFAYSGVTKSAEELMQKNGILWSDRKDLDGLLEFVKLRKLPQLED